MNRMIKVMLVVGGYALALGLATGLTYLRQLATTGPEYDAESGMYAFGDAALFCIVLAAASLPPSALGLYFVRGVKWFWAGLSVLAIVVAATGAGTALFVGVTDLMKPTEPWSGWASFAFLRVLGSPVLVPSVLLLTLMAPDRPTRVKLLIAAGLELLGSCWLVLHLFVIGRR